VFIRATSAASTEGAPVRPSVCGELDGVFPFSNRWKLEIHGSEIASNSSRPFIRVSNEAVRGRTVRIHAGQCGPVRFFQCSRACGWPRCVRSVRDLTRRRLRTLSKGIRLTGHSSGQLGNRNIPPAADRTRCPTVEPERILEGDIVDFESDVPGPAQRSSDCLGVVPHDLNFGGIQLADFDPVDPSGDDGECAHAPNPKVIPLVRSPGPDEFLETGSVRWRGDVKTSFLFGRAQIFHPEGCSRGCEVVSQCRRPESRRRAI